MTGLEELPLSFQQRRVWRLQGEGPAWRLQREISIRGPLDPAALRRALDRIAVRHEILRTAFLRIPDAPFPLQAVRGSGAAWSEVERPARVDGGLDGDMDEIVRRERRRAWDLAREPPLRAVLSRVSAAEHTLLLTLPALCADTRSLRNLTAELAAESLDGAGAGPRPAVVQYARFAEWQSALAADLERGIGPWLRCGLRCGLRSRDRLAELFDPVLPFSDRSPARFAPAAVAARLDPELAATLEAIADESRVPARDLLLSCWNVLLWRLTGAPEWVLGFVCDGRFLPELEGAAGPFAKCLPVESRLEAGLPFRVFAQRLHTARAAGGDELFFAFEEGLRALGFSPDSFFFPVSFDFLEREEERRAGAVCFTPLRQLGSADRFKLQLAGIRTGTGLAVELRYDAGLFQPAAARYLLARFAALLRSVAATPDSALGELDILGAAERQRLLIAGRAREGRAAAGRTSDRCVHERVAAQAARTPAATAVRCGTRRLTYGELDARASRLAHRLIERGLEPEGVVGIRLEQRLELVVGALAVLQAGGAILPLDPEAPRERLIFMLGDAAAVLLLTWDPRDARLPAPCPPALLLAAEAGMEAGMEAGTDDEARPEGRAAPDSLAGVIYTSGARGARGWPLGELVTHRNLVSGSPLGAFLGPLCEGAELALPLAPAHSPARLSDRSPGAPVYLLDSALQPVPAGVAGEICLGGAGLLRGYLGCPDATAETLVPHPLGAPGERLCRTGALARYRLDGGLEPLGRLDRQIEIQGCRIGLEEIEVLLEQLPRIREAAVVPRRGDPERLVACLVASRLPAPAGEELRRYLRERLPEPAVPSLFLVLPELPRAPGGQVDRRALAKMAEP